MRRNAGFTLLEFAVLITISGILMVAAIRSYLVYVQTANYYAMVDKMLSIKQTLADFNSNPAKYRYPCPADPSLPITDENAGVEAISKVGGVWVCWAMDPVNAISVGQCNPAGKPYANSLAGGICRVAGARDTLADTDSTVDTIEVGGLPFRSMKAGTVKQDMDALTMADGLDPWGYQFTYAITENAATQNNVGQGQWGAIDVRSETTTTTAGSGIELVLPDKSANYVVIGHGVDHNGAYNASGKVPSACGALPTSSTAPANSAVDNFNCTIGSTFVSGLLSSGTGPAHYDDYVVFSSGYITRLWDFVSTGSDDIYNINTGGVGVGASAMTQSSVKLELNSANMAVSGSMTACDSTNSTCWTPSTDAASICDAVSAGNCFNPLLLGGYDGSTTTGGTISDDNPYRDCTSSGTCTVVGSGSTNTYDVVDAQPSGNQCAVSTDATKVNVVRGIVNGQVQCTADADGVTPLSLTADVFCPGADTSPVVTPQTYVVGIISGGVKCARIDNSNCVDCTSSGCVSTTCP
jgi:type II secretory pathway pseudopilin PulG